MLCRKKGVEGRGLFKFRVNSTRGWATNKQHNNTGEVDGGWWVVGDGWMSVDDGGRDATEGGAD